jgi:hypothetical protein
VTDQSLAKVEIRRKDGDGRLTCQFNPKEYTIAKSASWCRTTVRSAQTASTAEFVGTNPRSLQMELFFDGWASGSGDVSQSIDRLMEWTNPTRQSIQANVPAPPIVFFLWGSKTLFDAYVKSVSARYSMFTGDGLPIRATASVGFEEVPNEPARQNPTSGGPGRRSHVVALGETLHSIAYGEYGDPTYWRGLATLNHVEDPLRLDPGTVLLIPPARQVAARS